MRKTSHDGVDTSSITSGLENELKKAGNKMKKNSIKRKVQNYSHESDDGIIEPLLQTDKEKSDIANKSAKFLLNKTKTDTTYERDNKIEDYPEKNSVGMHIRTTGNLITNNIKEDSISTSNVCGMAPVHNHMNTNVFSSYESTKVAVPIKSPILVEIDGNKSSGYSPSPLIFTTAKIHTDSKTKLMEPLQITPVPILSTIEGNIVKSGSITDADKKSDNFSSRPTELKKSVSGKPDVVQSIKDESDIFTTTSSFNSSSTDTIKVSLSTTKYEQKQGSIVGSSLKDTIDNANQKTSQLLRNTSIVETMPLKTNVLNNLNKTPKEPIISTSIAVFRSIDQTSAILIPNDPAKSSSNVKTLDQKYSSIEKSKDDKIYNDISNTQTTKADNKPKSLKSPTTTPSDIKDKITSISKGINITVNIKDQSKAMKNQEATEPVPLDVKGVKDTNSTDKPCGTKKLQRQNNALGQEAYDSDNSRNLKIDENSIRESQEKTSLIKSVETPIKGSSTTSQKVDHIKDTNVNVSKRSSITQSTKSQPISKIVGTSVTTSTASKPVVTVTTSSVKTVTDKISPKPLPITSKDIPKSIQTSIVSSSSNTKSTIKESSIVKPSSSVTSNIKSSIPISNKPKVTVTSSQPSQSSVPSSSVKCSSPSTTLPSYIVSTSKTKIGSTITSSTPTNTTKSQTLTSDSVYTASGTMKTSATQQRSRPTVSSPTNGTKHSNFSKQTKSDTIKKDGRA